VLAPIIKQNPPDDLSEFWKKSISELKSVSQRIEVLETISFQPGGVQVQFSFRGYKNQLLYGYYLMHEHKELQPTVVFYHGFGYHGGKIKEHMHWFNEGYAVVTYDFRGQGGKSRDDFPYENQSEHLMTNGIENKDAYYLKHTVLDSYQFYQVAKALHFVDQNQMILDGFSQGGGIVLILAAFLKPLCICADVPSYSYFYGRYLTGNGSVLAIKEYVVKNQLNENDILKQLSYFDLIHLAPFIKSPVIISVGLKDMVCPAAYFEPTYEQIKSKKIIYSYPDSGHEGGGKIHEDRKLSWVKEIISEHKGTTQ